MSPHQLDPFALDRAWQLISRRVEEDMVPFGILGVAGAERVVRLDAVPPREGPRIGANAVCLLASITKPIVAMAIARLAQDGRFPLNVPLGRWLPELDAAGLAPFTAWHVLTHTSGIADIDLERLLLDGGNKAELVRRTIAGGQMTPPGSRFLYASFTFDLLAAAVERALDRPFEVVLREEVLELLGMHETFFDPAGVPGERVAPIVPGGWDGIRHATSSGASDEQLVRAYTSLHLAGGGLWSTASDLLRFGRAMLRGGELDGARVVAPRILGLFTREVTVNGLGATGDRLGDEHYAMGWGKPGPTSPASPAAFGHGGVSGTRLWIDPAFDLVIVFLSGCWGLPPQTIDEIVLSVYAAIE
jgi:serine-type D-Ala-D-Ala carboxypeptidase